MASGLNLFWATSSAGSGCYSYTRYNNKDQQNEYPKQLRPKPEVRLPRQRGWGGTYHSNMLTLWAFWVPNTIASFSKAVNGSLDVAIDSLTSNPFPPRLTVGLLHGQSHQWGRHGFDGDACGQEACRGAHTRNRGQNDNCQSTNGIRSLIN